MKICDVVTNTIWYDPRVNKQIEIYLDHDDIKLECVGLYNSRYNKEKIDKISCPINIVEIDKKYYRHSRTFLTKIIREIITIYKLRTAVIKTKADIIHANDLDALVPAYLASKKLKCKLIYDTHEIFLENNNIAGNKFKKMFWGRWEKKIIIKADQVLCVSNAAAEYLASLYHIKKPMVITNCVNKFSPKTALQRSNSFEVLNHGQFYEGRGYDIMAKSAKFLLEYPEIQLVIRGFGKQEQEIRDIIDHDKVSNFRIDEPVTVQELIPMAAKSHIGIAITESINLNFELSVSNKLFEYAAAGLPVIMSDIPEHRYLNEKYNFGIILSDNTPETLAKTIINLYKNPTEYERLKQGSLKMSNELNWENEFQKVIDIERNLLGEKKC